MSDWTIKGQSGKHFPASTVDVEVVGMQNGVITWRNQGVDTISFLLLADDHATDPTYLPDKEQEITVTRAGTRQFVGYVKRLEYVWSPGQSGWIIEAQNGWSELDRVPLSSTDKEYYRAQGALATTVADILAVAIAGGARIQVGSIAAMFDIPPISIRSGSCGSALIELLKIVADAVAYFDYTGTGYPTVNIVRRGSMTTKTVTIGTDEIDTLQMTPAAENPPTKITVAYATANANGVVTEAVQTAGSGTDVQSVILTASNVADFQTKAAAAQVTMQTQTTANWAFALARNEALKNIPGLPSPYASGTEAIPFPRSTYTSKTITTVTGTAPVFSGFTSPNNYPLLQGEVKDYMTAKIGITKGVCRFGAHFWWRIAEENASGPVDPPDWSAPLMAAGGVVYAGWVTSATGGFNVQSNNNTWKAQYIRLYVEFEAVAISQAFATATAVRDPGDYGTLAPPSGLATALLAAQNWQPHKGVVKYNPWAAYERSLHKKIDVAGTNSRLAGIGALVEEEQVQIQTGMRELRVGNPARSGGDALARLAALRAYQPG
jgi:hypothetical protein